MKMGVSRCQSDVMTKLWKLKFLFTEKNQIQIKTLIQKNLSETEKMNSEFVTKYDIKIFCRSWGF